MVAETDADSNGRQLYERSPEHYMSAAEVDTFVALPGTLTEPGPDPTATERFLKHRPTQIVYRRRIEVDELRLAELA